jgi:hypothetical protein
MEVRPVFFPVDRLIIFSTLFLLLATIQSSAGKPGNFV